MRTSTEIGANSVSMAAAAVRLAERIFPSVKDQACLFIGAGEMIELCMTHFAAQHPRRMTVANRTAERARPLAERFGAGVIPLTALPDELPAYDIIITSTASPLPILGKGMLERAIKQRRHRPIFIVDLAVPRDVEAEVADMDDVFLYSVDDLGQVVREGMDNRVAQVAQAEAIIETSVESFVHWMEGRELVPVIRSLRDNAERHRRHEIEKAEKALARGDDPRAVLEALAEDNRREWFKAHEGAFRAMTAALRSAGVTPEQVQAVARKYLDDKRLTVAVLDPLPMGKGGAAELLGLKRTTLYGRMKKLGIERKATIPQAAAPDSHE